MKNQPLTSKPHLTDLQTWKGLILLKKSALCKGFISILLLFGACQKSEPPTSEDDTFFERQNAAHNGDYLATYPLSNPDSCIARLKAEVPTQLQPWACLSLWYHLPRTSPQVSFRLLDLYEKNYPHDTVSAFVQMVRGEWYVELAKHDSARICLEDAERRYLKLNRPLDASDAPYLLARSLVYQNNPDEAIPQYFKVLDLLNSHDTTFTQRHAHLYHDMIVAYERGGNREQELAWLQKAWRADHSQLDKPDAYKMRLAHSFCLHYLEEQPDSSLYWAKLGIELSKNQGVTALPPSRLSYGLARAYFKKGDCAAALPVFKDAWRAANRNVPFDYYQVCRSLGECFSCVGQLDSAAFYLETALATPDTFNLAMVNRLLSEVHTQKRQWEKAYSYLSNSYKLTEKVFNAEKSTAIAQANARYETAQKERRIATLQAAQQASRLEKWIISLALLLALGLSVSLVLRHRAKRRWFEQEKLLLQQERELARAQTLLKTLELEHSEANLKNTREELDHAARLLTLKNSLIEELQMRLEHGIGQQRPAGISHAAADHPSFRSMKILTKEDWALFLNRFKETFPSYVAHLEANFPNLTAAELRLFLLTKLNFEIEEMADILGISEESVLRTRRRLSQKLGLADSRTLYDLVHGI